jgi:hypothetical protein
MLAVKPLTNKEVFALARPLPLQISHHLACRWENVQLVANPNIGKAIAQLKCAASIDPDEPSMSTAAREFGAPESGRGSVSAFL